MMRNILIAATAGLLTAALMLADAAGQVPQTLAYQGYLSDAAGQPLDATVSASFSLYPVQAGGTPLWSESQTIVPSAGLFSVTLGATGTPFPPALFNTPLWLGISVGTDAEMTPRRALPAAPYAQRAVDADTLAGFSAFALDQSSDVGTLQSGLASTASDVGLLQSEVTVLQADVSATESDIVQLQSGLATTDANLATVEDILPNLQYRVDGSCAPGSAIRQITSSGAVACEIDDGSPWFLNDDRIWVTGRRISVGSSLGGPPNSLHVNGDTGLGTRSPNARLSVEDSDWQMTFENPNAGGNDWYVGSSSDGWGAGGGKLVFSPTSGSSGAALVLDSSRNVGIGTVVPQTRLHVKGGSDVTPAGGGYITVGDTTGGNIAIDGNEIMARNNGSATTLALNAQGGRVTVNSGGSYTDDAVEITGTVTFKSADAEGIVMEYRESAPNVPLLRPTDVELGNIGSSTYPFRFVYSKEFRAQTTFGYGAYSDRAIKRNVEPIRNALQTVQRLQGVHYELAPDGPPTSSRPRSEREEFARRNQLGFIAQDLEKILPQLVGEEPDNGLKTVAYMGVIPVLVEAIKEQQRQIDELQRRLAAD